MMDLEIKNTAIPDRVVDQWQKFVDTIADFTSVPSVMINRVVPPDLEIFRANVGPDNPFPSGTQMRLAGVYCETTARRRQKLQVNDAPNDPQWADSPTAKAGICAYLGYPLCWPDGAVFGTFCVIDTKANPWGRRYETLIESFKDAVETHLALLDTIEKLHEKNAELELALREVKTLRGLLPICASCKKIRDDQGYWNQIECYIQDHSEAEFTHSICPDCARRLYPHLDIYAGS